LSGAQLICVIKVSFDKANENDFPTLQLLHSLCENKVAGIGAQADHSPVDMAVVRDEQLTRGFLQLATRR
jgi:hypothetical protein